MVQTKHMRCGTYVNLLHKTCSGGHARHSSARAMRRFSAHETPSQAAQRSLDCAVYGIGIDRLLVGGVTRLAYFGMPTSCTGCTHANNRLHEGFGGYNARCTLNKTGQQCPRKHWFWGGGGGKGLSFANTSVCLSKHALMIVEIAKARLKAGTSTTGIQASH